MELHDALSQIHEIRQQMARTEVFRGYRAAPVAFTGLLAFAAAGLQPLVAPDPAGQLGAYLALWIGAAAVGALAAGTGMVMAALHPASAWRRHVTWMAVEQFVPCLVAGALVTAVIASRVPEDLGMLPGLWQVLFSLGIFASCRVLPRATFGVAVWYLACGLVCLSLARGEWALSPWTMGIPFGVGQLLAAAVLYWTLERGDVEP